MDFKGITAGIAAGLKSTAAAILNTGTDLPHLAAITDKPRKLKGNRAMRQRAGSKRGNFMRHIIKYERLGPFYKASANPVPAKLPSGRVIQQSQLVQYYVHRMLHATKGWRTYSHIPAGSRRFA